MNFHLKSDRYERKRVPVLKGISVVFVCFILIQMIVPTFLPRIAHRIFSPFWNVNTNDSAQTIAELQAKIESLSLIEKEHTVLLDELGQRKPSELLFARVLTLPPQSIYDTLIIDTGSIQGISVGKKVFAGNNILLGEVVEVYEKTSKVKLFSSPDEKYEVIIGTASSSVRATGIGRGNGMFEALVPREAKVTVGDIVTVPQISATVYGKVSFIITDPARAFDSVLFQSSIPLQSLRRVYVEK